MTTIRTAALVALFVVACGPDPQSAPFDDPINEVQQASHGPAPNLQARLIDGANSDWVSCEGRTRGLVPNDVSGYQGTMSIQYPSGGVVSMTGNVTLAMPTHVDASDGDFSVTLVESPADSGEYSVHVSFKRDTTERTAGAHRCSATIEVDGNGDGIFESMPLFGNGAAAENPTSADTERASTTVRQIGTQLICRSRLNNINPATGALYSVAFSALTDGGLETISNMLVGPSIPVAGPFPVAGGLVIVELGTPPPGLPAPSVDVLFGFNGQFPGSLALCGTQIFEGGTLVMDNAATSTLGAGI